MIMLAGTDCFLCRIASEDDIANFSPTTATESYEMLEQTIETEFGTLWAACSTPSTTTSKSGTALLFLHGDSADSRIFGPLLSIPELKDNYKLVVFDYPGHGRSRDAPDPDKAYLQYAYAEAAVKVLQHYNVDTVIPIGWSVGGHVALELVLVLATQKDSNIRVAGIVMTGTAPVRKLKIVGFRKDCDMLALFNPQASEEDKIKTADSFTNSRPAPKWLVESILRTDRVAAGTMGAKFMQGHCSDQVQIFHEFKDGPIAVINGEDDAIIDLNFCDDICRGAPSLWRGKCIRLPGLSHAPFYDDPQGYDKVLLEYLGDCRI